MKNIINEEFVPKRATTYSAGYDIYLNENINLKANEYTIIDTGIVFEDDDILFNLNNEVSKNENGGYNAKQVALHTKNYVGIIFPRSSYGFKYGLRFANSICVIDQDYRDTIKLKVKVDTDVSLNKGDRIAQIIFVNWLILSNEIIPTNLRGGGVGSTGE